MFRLPRLDTLTVLISCGLAAAGSAFFLLAPVAFGPPGGSGGGRQALAEPTGPVRTPDGRVVSVVPTSRTAPDGRVIVRYVTIYPSGRKEVHEYPSQTQVADVQRPAPRYLIDFGIFAFPVLLAALPLAFNGTRWRAPARVVAAALLASGVLLSSVGMFYLPSAAAMAVAAAFSFSGK